MSTNSSVFFPSACTNSSVFFPSVFFSILPLIPLLERGLDSVTGQSEGDSVLFQGLGHKTHCELPLALLDHVCGIPHGSGGSPLLCQKVQPTAMGARL